MCSLIYIPLWFYLYFARNWDSLREIIFTFHYGSTYTKMQEQLNKSVKSFTFHYGSTYTDTAQGWYHFLIHLHSTMVLLIRRKWPEIRNWTGIYIPLWFYLYAYTFKTPLKAFYIYIPLWFYLYNILPYIGFICTIFTFHYGSTYTRAHCMTQPWRGTHLHSTMVLLIRRNARDYFKQDYIYIPLWFYLYNKQYQYTVTVVYLHSTMVLLILLC